MDSVYLDVVGDRFPDATDQVLLDSRDATCKAFDLDGTAGQWVLLIKEAIDNGIEAEDAGFLIGAQVRTGCPEHLDALPQ